MESLLPFRSPLTFEKLSGWLLSDSERLRRLAQVKLCIYQSRQEMWRKMTNDTLAKCRQYCQTSRLRPFAEIPRAEVDYPVKDIHWVNQARHGKLGPMYRDTGSF